MKTAFLFLFVLTMVFTAQSGAFSEAFHDLPSMWKVGFCVGVRPNSYTMIGFPLAVEAGYIWPNYGFGIDLRGDFAGSIGGFGVVNGSSVFLVPYEVCISVIPRVGPGNRNTWIHAIFPVGIKLQPYDFNDTRRHAFYVSIGTGLGLIHPIKKQCFIQIETAGFLEVRANAETSWTEQVVPRFRWGGELSCGIGLRL